MSEPPRCQARTPVDARKSHCFWGSGDGSAAPVAIRIQSDGKGGDGRAHARRYPTTMLSALPVPKPLLGVVDGFWSFTGDGQSHRILPDGCLDFVFALDSASALVAGAMSSAQIIAPPAGAKSFGIRFRPGQAARFIDAAAHELLDGDAELGALTRVRELAERIAEARDDEARCAVASEALLDTRNRTRPADARLDHALSVIRLAPAAAAVSTLAASCGLSERQFGRRFLERVGIGPKRFARIMRLEHALTLARDSAQSQAVLAVRAGYSDEPHLLRDFRALTGLTPKALAAERRVGFVQDEPAASD
jgi:AraC-like DNA-binding protein